MNELPNTAGAWHASMITVRHHEPTDLGPPSQEWCGTQSPVEFNAFVDRLLDNDVVSILCIGVADGGNQWRIGQRYKEAGKRCRILGIDVKFTLNLLRTIGWMIGELSNSEFDFRLCDSRKVSAAELEGPYDAAFIDGTHAYEVAKNDYELVDPIVTKLIGFHDINNIGFPNDQIGSHDLWEEVKVGRRYDEFIEGKKFGIGVLYKD